MSLQQDIPTVTVPSNSVHLWWLGQAGFAFKTPSRQVVLVDPYLSDAVERLHGFKRLSLSPIRAEDLRADLVLLTHEHTDHLDPDAIPILARNHPRCRFAAPVGCDEGLTRAGISPERRTTLSPNRSYDLGAAVVHTAPADHGEYSTTALALLLDFDGIRVLLTGDTSPRPDLFAPLLAQRPDVVLPCINGGFGNLNPRQAAQLVRQSDARYAVPCHFWMFAEQGNGDPGSFLQACEELCPAVRALLLAPGEGMSVSRREK
ncbi:MAG: MBL fold metallo-hydrolase [Phycisphaerae bacterium]|nr:MBL fold metallo-hydrolase [Phycisphaerae bacterium]